jgi:hypothetical protein
VVTRLESLGTAATVAVALVPIPLAAAVPVVAPLPAPLSGPLSAFAAATPAATPAAAPAAALAPVSILGSRRRRPRRASRTALVLVVTFLTFARSRTEIERLDVTLGATIQTAHVLVRRARTTTAAAAPPTAMPSAVVLVLVVLVVLILELLLGNVGGRLGLRSGREVHVGRLFVLGRVSGSMEIRGK